MIPKRVGGIETVCPIFPFMEVAQMSFDKHMGKEHRKPYHGSKAFDSTCRNHGSCPCCQANRTHKTRKRLLATQQQLKDFQNQSK